MVRPIFNIVTNEFICIIYIYSCEMMSNAYCKGSLYLFLGKLNENRTRGDPHEDDFYTLTSEIG